MDKKIVVISGVNLVDGGPLSVYLDFLTAIVENGYSRKYKVIALVGKKELFEKFSDDIELIEYHNSKKSWINRLYLEYIGFRKFSKKLKVEIWISMHDMTPNVISERRYVYCHNPSPFNKMSIKDAKYGMKYYLFSKFYKYLYKINIKKNDAVIVQQDWMRQEFKRMYKLKNVIVARPSISFDNIMVNKQDENSTIFVAPSFPRYYKNFELICEAAKKLSNNGIDNFKVYITLSGMENSYSKMLKKKYADVKSIIFCGLLSRERLFKLYGYCNCMIFVSKLETWGVPISEFEVTNKPIIVADLPYAHETVGEYNDVRFVDVNTVDDLVQSMESVIKFGTTFNASYGKKIDNPYADGWSDLCNLIL